MHKIVPNTFLIFYKPLMLLIGWSDKILIHTETIIKTIYLQQ